MKTCSECGKELGEITPATGIELDSGKAFCWNCALKKCEAKMKDAKVFRGAKF